jgi:hypothetical protein
MALLYPWATKEYVLWNMSYAQVILYHNEGIDIKYPKSKEGEGKATLANASADEVREKRDELRRLYGNV